MTTASNRIRLLPRRVDFLGEQVDFNCALLGQMGFGTGYIAQQTGLSKGQVLYRLRKAAVRRAQLRRGESPYASLLVRACAPLVGQTLRRDLREVLKHQLKASNQGQGPLALATGSGS